MRATEMPLRSRVYTPLLSFYSGDDETGGLFASACSRRRYQRRTDGRARGPWLGLTKICSPADGRGGRGMRGDGQGGGGRGPKLATVESVVIERISSHID